MAADTWGKTELGARLAPYTESDISTVREKLRQLRIGTRAPTLRSWLFVVEALPDVNLRRWLEHPLFLLLNPPKKGIRVGDHGADMADYAKVRRALDMMEGEIRDYLWQQSVSLDAGTGTDLLEFSKDRYVQVIESNAFEDLDWAGKLTVMAALAKLGQWRGNEDLWRNASRWTRSNFARAVAVTPQLLVGWPWLSQLFESQVWSACRARARRLDFFEGPVGKREIEAMVRTAEWHRERFGIFEALPNGEVREPALPYVSRDFLERYCSLDMGGS